MDLEVRQDERFQRREWRVERVGWVVLVALVLAALAGLLGPGPFSWRTVTSSGELVAVDYHRVGRFEADDSMTFTFSPDAVHDGTIAFRLTGPWIRAVDLQSMTPEPSETAIPDGVLLELPVEGTGSVVVTLAFRAQALGDLRSTVSVKDDTASFHQFVLP